MILPMTRIQITGLKPAALDTMQALHQLGSVELDRLPTGASSALKPLALTPRLIQQQEKLGQLVAQVDSLILALNVAAGQPTCDLAPELAELLPQIEVAISPLAEQVRTLVARRDSLERDLAALPRYEDTLRRLVPLVPAIAHQPDHTSTVLLVPRQYQWLLDSVRAALAERSGPPVTIVEENISEAMRAMLIVAPHEASPQLAALIGEKNISQLQLPQELHGLPPDSAVVAIRRRLQALPAQLQSVEDELFALGADWAERLLTYRACLQDRLAEIRALDLLGMTEFTFVLQGWTPERDMAKIAPALHRAVGEAIVVERLPLTLKPAVQYRWLYRTHSRFAPSSGSSASSPGRAAAISTQRCSWACSCRSSSASSSATLATVQSCCCWRCCFCGASQTRGLHGTSFGLWPLARSGPSSLAFYMANYLAIWVKAGGCIPSGSAGLNRMTSPRCWCFPLLSAPCTLPWGCCSGCGMPGRSAAARTCWNEAACWFV